MSTTTIKTTNIHQCGNITVRKTLEYPRTFPELRSHQAILIRTTDNETHLLTNTNRLGGVCDDCVNHELLEKTIQWWAKVTVFAKGGGVNK